MVERRAPGAGREADLDLAADAACAACAECAHGTGQQPGLRQFVVVDEHQHVALHGFGERAVARVRDALALFAHAAHRRPARARAASDHRRRVVAAAVVDHQHFEGQRAFLGPHRRQQRRQPLGTVVGAHGKGQADRVGRGGVRRCLGGRLHAPLGLCPIVAQRRPCVRSVPAWRERAPSRMRSCPAGPAWRQLRHVRRRRDLDRAAMVDVPTVGSGLRPLRAGVGGVRIAVDLPVDAASRCGRLRP